MSIHEYDHMKFLRFRFISGLAWDSKVIEWDTGSPWSHVEHITPDGVMTFGAELNGGVIWRSVDNSCYRNLAAYEIWSIACEPYQSSAFFDFIAESTGKPYDWRAILRFALGDREWQDPDSWFCSEWCAMSLVKAGLVKPPIIPASRITPRDFYWLLSMLPGARRIRTLEFKHRRDKVIKRNPDTFAHGWR